MCAEAPRSQYEASKGAIRGGGVGAVLRVSAVLDVGTCAALRAALDANGTSTVDSVDRMRSHGRREWRAALKPRTRERSPHARELPGAVSRKRGAALARAGSRAP